MLDKSSVMKDWVERSEILINDFLPYKSTAISEISWLYSCKSPEIGKVCAYLVFSSVLKHHGQDNFETKMSKFA